MIYEDHLYYPMVIGHRIVEMLGKDIKKGIKYHEGNKTVVITVDMWNDVVDRIAKLEKELHEKDNGEHFFDINNFFRYRSGS